MKDLFRLMLYAVAITAMVWGFTAMFSGCTIRTDVRPTWFPAPKPPPEVQPAPPKEPDPYDWEPWWSRPRPKQER